MKRHGFSPCRNFTTRFESLLFTKIKTNAKGISCCFGRKEGLLVFRTSRLMALSCHRHEIHYHSLRVLFISKTKNHPTGWLFILAGVEGLEPSRTVLETGMLPLHHTPIYKLPYYSTTKQRKSQ